MSDIGPGAESSDEGEPMAPYPRPIRAEDLLASPEMTLRYPGEHRGRLGSTADEGEGTGFDNMFPAAYVERWFDSPDPPERVGTWFAETLAEHGWQGAEVRPDSPAAAAVARLQQGLPWSFRRGDDERLGLYPMHASTYRLHYQVEGAWPDGSTDPRPS